MPKNSLKTLFILFFILGVTACGVGYYLFLNSKEAKTSTASVSLTGGVETPFTDINGNVVDLTEYANQIRVVNSWATWSPLSKDELPTLNDIASTYIDKGVVFLAINRKETKEYAGGYLNTLPALSNLKVVFDPGDNYFKNVEGYAMPETIVFDKEGNISAHFRGLVKKEELIAALETLLSNSN